VWLCIAAGPLHHYHAAPQDVAWGCGWRNIQMLSSHLLQRNEVAFLNLLGMKAEVSQDT